MYNLSSGREDLIRIKIPFCNYPRICAHLRNLTIRNNPAIIIAMRAMKHWEEFCVNNNVIRTADCYLHSAPLNVRSWIARTHESLLINNYYLLPYLNGKTIWDFFRFIVSWALARWLRAVYIIRSFILLFVQLFSLIFILWHDDSNNDSHSLNILTSPIDALGFFRKKVKEHFIHIQNINMLAAIAALKCCYSFVQLFGVKIQKIYI